MGSNKVAQKKEQIWKKIDLQAIGKVSQNKNLMKIGVIVGSVIFLIGLLIFVFNWTYQAKIMPKTYYGGVNLGGKTKAEAVVVLSSKLVNAGESNVELKYLDQTWKVNSKDLDVNYKVQSSVDEAWRIGREGSFKQIAKEQLKAVFLGNHQGILFSYNQPKLNSQILGMTDKIDQPEQDATIEIKDLNPVVVEEKVGKKSDFGKIVSDISSSFGNLKQNSVYSISVGEVQPKVKKEAAESALIEVKQILSEKIVLKSAKQDFTVEPKDFAGWLSFVGEVKQSSLTDKIDLKSAGNSNDKNVWSLTVTTDSAKIGQYVNNIAGNINQGSIDAKFQVQDGKVTAFQNSQIGYELDKSGSYTEISKAILGTVKTINLPVKEIKPTIGSDSAAQMGLTELVGEGKTSWRGSPVNRIHNLTLGAKNLSGIIVKPGEEFSTVKSMGPITAEAGFRPELVIKNSTQVTPEIGGGLCQVSTTLFRSVLNSGLEITDRSPHSFRVSYYEPPVGMDATIYDPAPDFKFKNNMSTPILIWAFAGSNSLTFQIYGTKDGRKVEISDPSLFNYVSPPGTVYAESASMEPGTVRQVERATPGVTASFHYKVSDVAGKILQEETFVSKYVALPNSYLYGAGYVPPAPDAPPAE